MLNRDFKECVASFNAHGVEYLVVGGYALAAHGFGLRALPIAEADLITDGNVIQLGYPPRRIDLLTSIDGVEFEACHARRLVLTVDGVDLPIIGLDDFKANKRATGRTQDRADLEALDSGDD